MIALKCPAIFVLSQNKVQSALRGRDIYYRGRMSVPAYFGERLFVQKPALIPHYMVVFDPQFY